MNSNQVLVTRDQKYHQSLFLGDIIVLMECSFFLRREHFLVSENIISKEASAPNLLIFWYFAFGSMSNVHVNIIFWGMGNLEMYEYGILGVELIK